MTIDVNKTAEVAVSLFTGDPPLDKLFPGMDIGVYAQWIYTSMTTIMFLSILIGLLFILKKGPSTYARSICATLFIGLAIFLVSAFTGNPFIDKLFPGLGGIETYGPWFSEESTGIICFVASIILLLALGWSAYKKDASILVIMFLALVMWPNIRHIENEHGIYERYYVGTGDPYCLIYQYDKEGNVLYDAAGNPIPAWYSLHHIRESDIRLKDGRRVVEVLLGPPNDWRLIDAYPFGNEEHLCLVSVDTKTEEGQNGAKFATKAREALAQQQAIEEEVETLKKLVQEFAQQKAQAQQALKPVAEQRNELNSKSMQQRLKAEDALEGREGGKKELKEFEELKKRLKELQNMKDRPWKLDDELKEKEARLNQIMEEVAPMFKEDGTEDNTAYERTEQLKALEKYMEELGQAIDDKETARVEVEKLLQEMTQAQQEQAQDQNQQQAQGQQGEGQQAQGQQGEQAQGQQGQGRPLLNLRNVGQGRPVIGGDVIVRLPAQDPGEVEIAKETDLRNQGFNPEDSQGDEGQEEGQAPESQGETEGSAAFIPKNPAPPKQ